MSTLPPPPISAGLSAMAAGRSVTPVELVRSVIAPPAAAPSARHRWVLVTAYCPCPICCGKNAAGLTASGRPTSTNYGHFVAAPADLAFGTRVTIAGYNKGRPVPVLDRGGAIKGDRLDVFFPSHEAAMRWGRRYCFVTIGE